MASEKTPAVVWPEGPFIRVIYADKEQQAESESFSSSLNQNAAMSIAVPTYQEPPPDRLGVPDFILELVVTYLTSEAIKLTFKYLRQALLSYAKKHSKAPSRSLIIRLLDEKSGRRRDLGLDADQINEGELERLADASQEILMVWFKKKA